MELLEEHRCFEGRQQRWRHDSATLNCAMTFSIFLPPETADAPPPVVYWLSGLTCTDQNFIEKAGAQRLAAELGLILVAPDTSPRGPDVPDDPEGAWDFGLGAGFYVNATQAPWSKHYHMYNYVVHELPALIEANFPATNQRSISGHSMGGHGALVCALRNPGRYQSVSAFSPIVNPMHCPWGEKAFSHYLGEDRSQWQQWDTCELIATASERLPLLIDQGDKDGFLTEQLKPELLRAAAAAAGHPLTLRMQPGYDHSYYFIASFIDDHLRHHAKALDGAEAPQAR